MATQTSQADIDRAAACKPRDCTRTYPYCECGDAFKTAKDWTDGRCWGCRADAREGQDDAGREHEESAVTA